MCCVLSALLVLGSRAAVFIWWLINPARFNTAIPNFLMLLAGIIVLPLTTVVYSFVYIGGITGMEWLWLALGVLFDLGAFGGGEYGRRRRQLSFPVNG